MGGPQVGCELEPLFKGNALWLEKTVDFGDNVYLSLCLGVFFFPSSSGHVYSVYLSNPRVLRRVLPWWP